MKLITELVEDVNYIVEESESGQKKLFIEGVFLQADLKNRNGRIYPGQIMEREVARYTKDKIDSGRAFGELGHPDTPSINLDRVSHRIVSLRKEGSNYVGKASIINQGMGKIASGIIEDGGKLGVSSRGMGSLKNKNGLNEVQDDFFLATAADIVADPSAPDAFVNGIYEGVDWVWDNGILKAEQAAAHAKSIIDTKYKGNKEAALLEAFDTYLKLL